MGAWSRRVRLEGCDSEELKTVRQAALIVGLRVEGLRTLGL